MVMIVTLLIEVVVGEVVTGQVRLGYSITATQL
jgi:hypothetical protein